MAVRLTTWFVSQGISISGSSSNSKRSNSNSRFSFHYSPASSCKLRHRNLSCNCVNKRQKLKKKNAVEQSSATTDFQFNSDDDFQFNKDDDSESESASVGIAPVLNPESVSDDEAHANNANDSISNALVPSDQTNPSAYNTQDLVGMIRNAEKNIHLLNRARVNALQDLDKILGEKEALQGEMNALEMKLAETDARIRVAAQEKIKVELLGDQLDKMRNEMRLNGGGAERGEVVEIFENENELFNEEAPLPYRNSINALMANLNSLRLENVSLKNDVEELREELSNVKNTDERVVMLEKQRSSLESALKELESKLSVSQEDVSKLSNLKVECKGLWEKVENLQLLLDKATKQADQAIIVLQQNQEIRKKVDKLEESLEEANVYKQSSEKMQQYNELMQQKIKLMEERLQKSDEEIHSYVQLYQESVEEFQDTLNTLKEESKRRALDEPVDDMPWEFWSRLLLIIDGWLFENKISIDDAKVLREMVWKRDRRIHDSYMACKEKNVHEAVSTFLRLTSSQTSPGLHVVHIAAEMAPVAKASSSCLYTFVGGLGDVVAGLGKALQKKGHLVEIVIPKYDCMQYDLVRDLRALDVVLESYFDGRLFKSKVWVGTVEGLPVYFIEPLHPDRFFWRGQFYGERDDFKRFSFFSRAALELLLQSGKKPDIIHCHDWQTAFVAPLYWDLYAPKGLNSARICFTCHNFEYQGTAPASELGSCGLDVNQLKRPDRMQDNSSHDRINAVKGAVVFSNIVTTVSPTYAQEVRTAEGGHGLHSTLNFHSKKFIGILNGIDADAWNPATDTHLKVQYNANDLQGKAENKEDIRRNLGLSSADVRRPLREFEGIANHFENHDHIRLILKYDDSLSHSIFAASDMFIIPSIFEPCGLTQMIAMRYGSIPIVRKTGGLNDSVFDVDDDTIPVQFRNGYSFLSADERGVNGALERAFDLYTSKPDSWQQLVEKVMNMDFSWDSSASQYEELYSKSVARARAAAHTQAI
ncbi:hypothetical protein ACE6H2_013515 [Prunus campanulata]